MAYQYGHKATAYNGVFVWLQGYRNSGEQGINYLKGLDTNQMRNYVRRSMIDFLRTKDIIVHPKSSEDFLAKQVQEYFNEYTEFIKSIKQVK